MNNSLFRLLVFFLVQVSTLTAMSKETAEIPGADLACVLVAARHFQVEYPRAQLRHFVVQLSSRNKELEIVFVPIPPPGSTYLGGGNESGEEVHYVISRTSHKLIRTTYGR